MSLFPAGVVLLGLAASTAAFGPTGLVVYILAQGTVLWLKLDHA